MFEMLNRASSFSCSPKTELTPNSLSNLQLISSNNFDYFCPRVIIKGLLSASKCRLGRSSVFWVLQKIIAEPCQASKMEVFARIINSSQQVTI